MRTKSAALIMGVVVLGTTLSAAQGDVPFADDTINGVIAHLRRMKTFAFGQADKDKLDVAIKALQSIVKNKPKEDTDAQVGKAKSKELTNAQGDSTKLEELAVSPRDLLSDYKKNELAGEKKYRGKIVRFTGVAVHIGTDPDGMPYVLFSYEKSRFTALAHIKCYFKPNWDLASVEPGGIYGLPQKFCNTTPEVQTF